MAKQPGFWTQEEVAETGIQTGNQHDYLFISNVEYGTYRTPSGDEVEGVAAKRRTLTKNDYVGASFAISSNDVSYNIFTVTMDEAPILVNGEIHLRGAWWIIVGVFGERSDGSQTRVLLRRQRPI